MSTQMHMRDVWNIQSIRQCLKRQHNKRLKTLMSLQQLCHHADRLDDQLQCSQDPSLSPAVVFPCCQILGQDCCSSSRWECRCDEDRSLHHRNWVSETLPLALLDEDGAVELHRKEIMKHLQPFQDCV